MYIANEEHLGNTCEHCNLGTYIETIDSNDWWVKCNDCGALKFCYNPMPHQVRFHADPHKFRMYAGGFGSAKTSTCAAEMIRAALATPGGVGLIGAQTYPQLENTAKLEFKKMLTKELIKSESIQKNYIDLINDYRILFRSFDDEGKIRSLNLCHWWIEESSEVKYDIFAQLQTRLRSNKTSYHFGIMSTNPDIGWIRSDFLLKSDKINGTEERYYQEENDINRTFSSHIAKTSANTYLPPDFYETVAAGKPRWYIERYLEGSFSHTSGQVYPGFNDNIIEPFEIPKHWNRVFASDFGLRDNTVMLEIAIDPKDGVAYVCDEHYESGKPIPYHAEKMNKMMDKIPHGKILRLVGDPAGKRKSERDMRSIYDHYAEYGIYFEPGMNRIEDGIMKVFTYFMMGKLKIFSSCRNTVREGLNYKYKEQGLDSDKNADEKPVDKDNHAMDALRYGIQELPDDPNQLINKSIASHDMQYGEEKDGVLPYALQEDDEPYGNDWNMYY